MSDEELDGLQGLLLAAKLCDVATFKALLKGGDDVLQKDKVSLYPIVKYHEIGIVKLCNHFTSFLHY